MTRPDKNDLASLDFSIRQLDRRMATLEEQIGELGEVVEAIQAGVVATAILMRRMEARDRRESFLDDLGQDYEGGS